MCPLPPTRRQVEDRGWNWILGAFLICPCHLPFTLGVVATVLSGTAAGALLNSHYYVAGAVISLLWLAATVRGILFIRSARRRQSVLKP